jgi:hypothetical protein
VGRISPQRPQLAESTPQRSTHQGESRAGTIHKNPSTTLWIYQRGSRIPAEQALFEGLAWLKSSDDIKRNGTIMVEIIKHERLSTELINILRWEDDGGKIIEINYSMLDRQFVQPVLPNGGMHDTSLQWNKQFVIEPFQAGTRIDLIKRKAPANRSNM